MNFKLLILLICAVLIYNVYTNNNLFSKIKHYQKYYKIALIIIFGLGATNILNNSPKMSYENMKTMHGFIQNMPIDKSSKELFSPFFENSYISKNEPYDSVRRVNSSGKKSHKRSVSETKKKYVASQQNWKCAHCQTQLSAWFEVDHVVRLDQGGNNEVSNLEALCRECHGKKTSMENL